MEVYRSVDQLSPIADSALTIGNFDGLHVGHQAVIRRTVQNARKRSKPAIVITFDPHPSYVINPPAVSGKEMIVTLDRKLALMEQYGVDLVLVLNFTEELRQLAARDFLESVVLRNFHPGHIIIGYDHHFGRDRLGDGAFLTELSSRFNYGVDIIEGIALNGAAVSSSNIRELLHSGRCHEANQQLGWPYEIGGTVVTGADRGKQLGYPTANLAPAEPRQLVPKFGVYLVSSQIEGKRVFGICNVGIRPTFNEMQQTIEVHFLEFPDTDLYNRKIQLQFHHRMRDERKFNSEQELIARIEQDKSEAVSWISKYMEGAAVDDTV